MCFQTTRIWGVDLPRWTLNQNRLMSTVPDRSGHLGRGSEPSRWIPLIGFGQEQHAIRSSLSAKLLYMGVPRNNGHRMQLTFNAWDSQVFRGSGGGALDAMSVP
jgi:hypothetical protein